MLADTNIHTAPGLCGAEAAGIRFTGVVSTHLPAVVENNTDGADSQLKQ